MRGYDVVLISDLDDPALAAALGGEPTWLEALKTPLTGTATVPNAGQRVSGGIVIALDGTLPGGAVSNTWRALGTGSSNLVTSISSAVAAPPKQSGLPVGERECLDASLDDLAASIDGLVGSYWAPASSVVYALPSGTLQVTILFSSVASGGGSYSPAVMTRQYRSWAAPNGLCTSWAHP